MFPALCLAFLIVGCVSNNGGSSHASSSKVTSAQATPIVIGHRGASGYRPEHTLASYELAIEQGADFIEPDLVSTKDGVLIARHENEISETTDVSSKFPKRKTKKTIDGKAVEGWFTEDFTLAEIKTLRAKERLPFRSKQFDGVFQIPTLDEVLQFVKTQSAKKGRAIGVYPETKHPTYFRSVGLPLEDKLLSSLSKAGFDKTPELVFVQSFEVSNLKDMRKKSKYQLVQLVGAPDERPFDFVASKDARTYMSLLSPEGLKEVASYASGIGPHKAMIVQLQKDGNFKKTSELVAHAHNAGLKVHTWTHRVEEVKQTSPTTRPEAEVVELFKHGVDGVFTDFPDVAIAARVEFLKGR